LDGEILLVVQNEEAFDVVKVRFLRE